jgi:hypothetical protein
MSWFIALSKNQNKKRLACRQQANMSQASNKLLNWTHNGWSLFLQKKKRKNNAQPSAS